MVSEKTKTNEARKGETVSTAPLLVPARASVSGFSPTAGAVVGKARMKTTALDHHRVAFVEGYQSEKENPYIRTSNCSDAFELGKYAQRLGIDINVYLHKSRGFKWIMGEQTYSVFGEKIEVC